MELNARTRVPFPRELVFRTYRDRLPETVAFLPNVRSIEVKERRDDGGRTSLVNVWSASANVPSLARKFITEEMLRWTDRAEWDEAGWSCRWLIEIHAYPGLVDCSGTTRYVEAEGGTELYIKGDLVLHLDKVHVPRLVAGTVQPVVERFVVGALKPNLISTGEGVGRFLAAQPPG